MCVPDRCGPGNRRDACDCGGEGVQDELAELSRWQAIHRRKGNEEDVDVYTLQHLNAYLQSVRIRAHMMAVCCFLGLNWQKKHKIVVHDFCIVPHPPVYPLKSLFDFGILPHPFVYPLKSLCMTLVSCCILLSIRCCLKCKGFWSQDCCKQSVVFWSCLAVRCLCLLVLPCSTLPYFCLLLYLAVHCLVSPDTL